MTSDASPAPAKPVRPGWRDVLRRLRQPKVAVMLLLGFASGLPFMLVGNAGSAMKTGRSLSFSSPIPHNNVLTSVCNAMGAPIAKFGAASVCTGPDAECPPCRKASGPS